jgi:hypothetical protein
MNVAGSNTKRKYSTAINCAVLDKVRGSKGNWRKHSKRMEGDRHRKAPVAFLREQNAQAGHVKGGDEA